MKKILKMYVLFLAICIVVEIFGFNFAYFATRGNQAKPVDITASERLEPQAKQGVYALKKDDETTPAYFELNNIGQSVQYLYIQSKFLIEEQDLSCNYSLYIRDEGHDAYYKAGNISGYAAYPKTNYYRLHPYGKVQSVKLVVDEKQDVDTIVIEKAEINAKVPMFFSVFRVLLLSLVLLIIWCFRSQSSLYRYAACENSKKLERIKLAFITLNAFFFLFLLLQNVAYIAPNLIKHQQYQLLAEALYHGRTQVEIAGIDLIGQLKNPYDYAARVAFLEPREIYIWDYAYYQGACYVYFGIVPELLFYLPFYALTGHHVYTSVIILIMSFVLLLLSYSVVEYIIKTYFPKTSFGVKLFLSFLIGNSSCVIVFLCAASFYCLPVIMAIIFALSGLLLWLKARCRWLEQPADKKANRFLLLGALLMALSVGCRPQFALVSFLIIPVFWDIFIQNKKLILKDNLTKIVLTAIPYVLVAAGLMYYNYIRFDSPFEFGAKYNLTNNDVRLRGMNFGRLKDGIFAYFFQLPNVALDFPWIRNCTTNSNYLGDRLADSNMFGGVFFTHCFALVLLFSRKVKSLLKEKRLYGITVSLLFLSFVLGIADAEMGGIVGRYAFDFIWMILLAAVLVFLSMLEKYGENKKMLSLMVVLGLVTLAFNWFIGFGTSDYEGNPSGYYLIYNLFT